MSAQHHYVTPQQEGIVDTFIGDPLYEFLISNKHVLKADENSIIEEFYNKLSANQMDIDELMMSSEATLTDALKEYQLKASNVNRLIILMKKTENSAIYKEYNKKNVFVVALSTKEEQARKNMNNMKQKVLMTLTAIDNDLKQLNVNKRSAQNIVNEKYDEIIKEIIKQRDKLLTATDTLTNKESQKLLQQQQQFKNYTSQLIEGNKAIQKLIVDTTLDDTKREMKITSIATKLINDRQTVITSQYKKIKKIAVDIDINEILTQICKFGNIRMGKAPFPATLQITSIGSVHADITLVTDKQSLTAESLEYKIQCAEYNGHEPHDTDNMKLNWNTIIINNTNNCRIKSLKSLANYIVRASAKNKYGYSDYSKPITFKTDKLNWNRIMIPSARDLYFILHDILCFDLQLIPQLYVNHQCVDPNEYCEYHIILYLLSTQYLDEIDRNLINLQKVIQIGIDSNSSLTFLQNTNSTTYIVSEIACFCRNERFQFDETVLMSDQLSQVSFNNRMNEVVFADAKRDFMNVINDKNLLIEDCNGEVRIDSYILNRGDEMWIGVIDKSIYGPYVSVEHKSESLFYYYRGRIHAFGRKYYQKLDKTLYRYDKYDWVSFIIDKAQSKLTFYKNKLKVAEIMKLPQGKCLVYNAVVDWMNDGFFVEKVMFSDC